MIADTFIPCTCNTVARILYYIKHCYFLYMYHHYTDILLA